MPKYINIYHDGKKCLKNMENLMDQYIGRLNEMYEKDTTDHELEKLINNQKEIIERIKTNNKEILKNAKNKAYSLDKK